MVSPHSRLKVFCTGSRCKTSFPDLQSLELLCFGKDLKVTSARWRKLLGSCSWSVWPTCLNQELCVALQHCRVVKQPNKCRRLSGSWQKCSKLLPNRLSNVCFGTEHRLFCFVLFCFEGNIPLESTRHWEIAPKKSLATNVNNKVWVCSRENMAILEAVDRNVLNKLM